MKWLDSVLNLFCRRKKCMKIGDIVIYVMEFDADESYSPNLGPAIVTKVNSDGSLDLSVQTINGAFWRQGVQRGQPADRRTWHPKD